MYSMTNIGSSFFSITAPMTVVMHGCRNLDKCLISIMNSFFNLVYSSGFKNDGLSLSNVFNPNCPELDIKEPNPLLFPERNSPDADAVDANPLSVFVLLN